MENELLTHKEVAAWLKVAELTVRRWTRQGMPCLRFGRLVRYQQAPVLAWITGRAVRLPGRRRQEKAEIECQER